MILATVVWMLVAGVGALLASRLLDTSYGGALAQSVGMLTGTALLLVVMGRWGWLRAGGLLAAVSVQALMFGLLHIMQVAGGNPLDDALMTWNGPTPASRDASPIGVKRREFYDRYRRPQPAR